MTIQKGRLWPRSSLVLATVTALATLAVMFGFRLGSMEATTIAAVAIVLCGLPHGTLDVEIAATHFGQLGATAKSKIILAYISCAGAMVLFWMVAPAFALATFLLVSIVHFSRDWRDGVDPFFAMMVAWAIIALPALSHPESVAFIFGTLTGSSNGPIIAAILACTAAPAALGSLVFAYCKWREMDKASALEVLTCLVAALFLPPLVAFSIFFCGLHSPRHMAEALRETPSLSASKKAIIGFAVFALAVCIGVVLFMSQQDMATQPGLIRAAFVLISVLTVPHFALESGDERTGSRAASLISV